MTRTLSLSLEVPAGRWRLSVSMSGVPSILEGQDGRVIASFGPSGGEAVFELDAPEHLWVLYEERPESRSVRLEPVSDDEASSGGPAPSAGGADGGAQ